MIWRSFELDPAAPAERSGTNAEHLASKYGMSVEQAEQMNAQMTQTATGEGLDFHFDRARAAATPSTPTASCISPTRTASRTR